MFVPMCPCASDIMCLELPAVLLACRVSYLLCIAVYWLPSRHSLFLWTWCMPAAGTALTVAGVCEFMQWSHPQVTLAELHSSGAGAGAQKLLNSKCAVKLAEQQQGSTCYEDEWLAASALLEHGGTWHAPQWLVALGVSAPSTKFGAAGGRGAAPPSTTSNSSSSSSSSSSRNGSDSSSDEECASGSMSTSHGSSSSSDSDSKAARHGNRISQGQQTLPHQVQDELLNSHGTNSVKPPSNNSNDSSSSSSSDNSSSSSSDEDGSTSTSSSSSLGSQQVPHRQAGRSQLFDQLDHLFASAAPRANLLSGLRSRLGAGNGASDKLLGRPTQTAAARQRSDSNASQKPRLGMQVRPDSSAAATQPAQTKLIPAPARSGSTPASTTHVNTRSPTHVMSYLCLMKGINALMLVVSVPSISMLEVLRNHPALRLVQSMPELRARVAVVLHLTPSCVVGCSTYREWMCQLPGRQVLASDAAASAGIGAATAPAAATAAAALAVSWAQPCAEASQEGHKPNDTAQEPAGAGGLQPQAPAAAGAEAAEAPAPKAALPMQLPVCAPPCSSNYGLGFLASARVMARLHLVSSLIFQLPHVLTQHGSGASTHALTGAPNSNKLDTAARDTPPSHDLGSSHKRSHPSAPAHKVADRDGAPDAQAKRTCTGPAAQVADSSAAQLVSSSQPRLQPHTPNGAGPAGVGCSIPHEPLHAGLLCKVVLRQGVNSAQATTHAASGVCVSVGADAGAPEALDVGAVAEEVVVRQEVVGLSAAIQVRHGAAVCNVCPVAA